MAGMVGHEVVKIEREQKISGGGHSDKSKSAAF